MIMPKANGVKIKAKDSKELHVLASLLQDALVNPSEVAFDQQQQRFVLIANRFMWERDKPHSNQQVEQQTDQQQGKDASYDSVDAYLDYDALLWRVHAALRFEGVQAVQRRNWPNDDSQPLSLLSITPDAQRDHFLLIFSGQAAVRITTKGLSCALEDISEPWPTQQRPQHSAEVDEKKE